MSDFVNKVAERATLGAQSSHVSSGYQFSWTMKFPEQSAQQTQKAVGLEELAKSAGTTLANVAPMFKEMAKNGRLWVQEGTRLRRATGGEAAERLFNKEPVVVVTAFRQTSTRKWNNTHAHGRDVSVISGEHGFFEESEKWMNSSSDATWTEVSYATSTVHSVAALSLVEDTPGIPEAAALDGTSDQVQTSHSYSKTFSEREEHEWGLLLYGNKSSGDSGGSTRFVDTFG